MQIETVIERIKAYHKGSVQGKEIDPATTRDQVLYGDVKQECTGIVTTCWATAEVIAKAAECHANLIIAHEALFWNHGDHTDWLAESENKTYLRKKELLDRYGIVVWRNHDYIHSGIPMKDGSYTDGIFYGVADTLGWCDHIVEDPACPLAYEIEPMKAKDLTQLILDKFHLNGARLIGDPETVVKRIQIPFHVLGDDRELIERCDKEDIDCLLAMEMVDFTVAEYIRDASMLGQGKVIISVGHFNLEEPGMKYMLKYMDQAIGERIPCWFAQSGDSYHYITKK
ncbi:Nif3-like dinuclear metal center hexameric protein [Faecalibaculum rodentium]|uniref:Nif3-like dinuclear metal center hexameric protein n=1 Tax=Faecalibaculum rodentium TaxID=1702221 RepID=UPI00259C7DFC|nr:Nif3-like dinuclear metal center hexameric protein [Faecalibaculum rodentium]